MAKNAAEDAKKSNVTPGVLQQCIEEIDDWDARVLAATTALKRVKDQRKARRAFYEEEGIDLGLMDEMREDKLLDEADLELKEQNRRKYREWQAMDFGYQSEMTFQQPTPEEEQRRSKHDAYLQGKLAAKNGEPRGNNPHQAGTIAHAGFDQGWQDQDNGEWKDAGGDPAPAKPKRGRPRKGAGPEVAAKPAGSDSGDGEIGQTVGTA